MNLKLKSIRSRLLLFVLITGLPFQMCTSIDDDCNCPPVEGEFFDVNGISLENYKRNGGSINIMDENEVIAYANYYGFQMNYDVIFVSCKRSEGSSISFIPKAYACSCQENGSGGAKIEKLQQLTVTTLYDFNDEFSANDTINSLIRVGDLQLDDYLVSDTLNIMNRSLLLQIERPPTLDDRFGVKVEIELSNGERYAHVGKTILFE